MLQDGTHDLKSLGSGGIRLGPASLVRAVGRVIRSVVGGDSEDSHQHPVSFCHERKDIPPQHHIIEEHFCQCTNEICFLPEHLTAFSKFHGACLSHLSQ